MIEITDPDLLDIFIGRQNIDNVHENKGVICFDLYTSDPDTETTKKPISREISQSDFEDIEGFFGSTLQSRPFAKHLLQILWIREVKFKVDSLKDDDLYDFIQRAFALYGVDIDEETVENEFFELLYEGYFQETNAGFSLTPMGKCVAEELFKAMKMFVPANVNPPSITAVGDGIAQLARELATLAEKNKSVKTKKSRKRQKSKYEKAVEDYLHDLVEAVKRGDQKQEFAAKLKSEDVALALQKKKEFKHTTNASIQDRLRRSTAWKNRQDILKQLDGLKPHCLDDVYDSRTYEGKKRPIYVNKVDCNLEYDPPVEEFLQALRNEVLCGKMNPEKYCSIVSELTPKVVARWIEENKPAFGKRSIATIANGVEYSSAWINREQILNTEEYTK